MPENSDSYEMNTALLHTARSTLAGELISVCGRKAADGISRLEARQILIYGAGNYGRVIYRLLTRNGIPADNIRGFLDMAADRGAAVPGVPVFRPEDQQIPAALKETAEVIISVYISLGEHEKIAGILKGLGYRNVRSGYETAISFHMANDPAARISGSDFWHANTENILKGCEYWNDRLSLETYLNHFVGHIHCDIGRFLLETGHRQYFAPSPLAKKGCRRFIDCGAFDGDTVRDMLEICGKAEALALFEPCGRNFSRLGAFVHDAEGSLAEQVILFPCGVWDRTEQLRFNAEAEAASSLSAEGESFIQCISLDDALHGFKPTFIKMDIEGAEPEALRGAERIIKRFRPDLAISVYHSLSHFWEISGLVRQMVPEYRLYLRTYGAAGHETVMYAVCAD